MAWRNLHGERRWRRADGGRLVLRADGRLVEWVPGLRRYAVRVVACTPGRAAAEARRRGYPTAAARPLAGVSASKWGDRPDRRERCIAPAPPAHRERVELYRRRWAARCDLYTGEPLPRLCERVCCARCGEPARQANHLAGQGYEVRDITAPGLGSRCVDVVCPACGAAGVSFAAV